MQTTTSETGSVSAIARHLPALDGLRGIAILVVVILHATESLDRILRVRPEVLAITNVGFTGVDLFFVLSGFLITGILIRTKGREGFLRVFYMRRTLRIFPLYYAYLAIVFLVLPLLPLALPSYYGALREHQFWYWAYLSNVLNAIRGGWGIDGAFTTHFWSLAVEEQFYLIWPTVVLLLSGRALRNACILLIVGVPLLRIGLRLADVNPVAVYVLTICRADALAAGALVACLAQTDGGIAALRRHAPKVLLISLGALTGVGAWRGGFGQFDVVQGTIGFSLWAAFYGAALTAAVTSPPALAWLPRLLSAGWLRFLGKYSYALYVFHRPMCGVAETVIPIAQWERWLGPGGAGVAFVAFVMMASLACAIVSWTVLESRFIALKDRYTIGSGSPAAVPGT